MEMKISATSGESIMIDKAVLQNEDTIELELMNGAKLSLQVSSFGFEVDSQDELSLKASFVDKLTINCEVREKHVPREQFATVLRYNGVQFLMYNNTRLQVSVTGGEKLYVRVLDDSLEITRRQCMPVAVMGTADNSFYFFVLNKDPRAFARTDSNVDAWLVTHILNSAAAEEEVNHSKGE